MSYSSGRSCHHHLLLFSFFLLLLLTSPATMTSVEDDGATTAVTVPSSREEMMQLAGYGEEKLSTVLVTGSLVCHACSPPPSSHDPPRANENHDHGDDDQLHEWPIPGALVAVNCLTRGNKKRSASVQTLTDEFGDFTIDLPSELHGIPEMDKTCCVTVLRMPKKTTCRPAYVQKHKALELYSVGNGIRNYSAGKIPFLHSASKPLQACSKTRHTIETEIAI
ncbi:unnamed protein product [Linum tenue]|uniref:Pollen Ole e 1 allergen and extensin family protein n=1 Tax=Linum tenue TaxID=586396 RepID=A0AAV0GP70_9ROSI|nr:unnamed protein product [Linum tenue]